jgi:hypothetical protein
MSVKLASVLIFLNLCGTSGGRVGDTPTPPYAGEGWSIRLPPEGATVKATASRISVDAKDFSRWFDIRWDELYGDLSIPVRNLAAVECDPVVWDEPTVEPDAWTAGALCTRKERFEWLIARVERHGDRALVFFYVANRDFLAYEDAWVDFSTTVATFGPGKEPPVPPEGRKLRQTVREAVRQGPPSLSTLPGGRVMSLTVIPALTEVWAMRRARGAPPERWGPDEAP